MAFGKETTQGTPPAAASFKSWGLVQSFEPEENKQHEQIRGLGSRQVQIHKAMAYEVTSSGTFYLQNPLPIYYALGKVTKTGAANAWVHTISSVGRCEELPTFTAQQNICLSGTPFIRNYSGSKVDTLTISGSAGEAVEVSLDMIHQKVLDNATAASSYNDSLNEPLTFADGTVTINNSTSAIVKEFEVEIANNLEALFAISKGNEASMINEGVQDITGSFTFALTDKTQWDLFKSGSAFNVSLRFDDPTTPANYFTINLTGAKYDANSIQPASDSEVDQELDVLFTGISVVAGSKDISDLTV
nr:phage tail tube protein [Bacillus wiedmannii]